MGEKKTFREKFMRNLTYRIMTAILVTVVPLCLVTVIIAIVTLYNSSERMHERILRQTETNMERLEAAILRIEDYAEEFVDEYMAELNSDRGLSDQLVPYDMIGDLHRLFSHTGLKGAVYCIENETGNCLVKSGDSLYLPYELDQLRDYVAENAVEGFESISLNGYELMRREYAYSSARVGFVVDISASIDSFFPTALTDDVYTYIQNGQSVFRHRSDGTIDPVSEDLDILNQSALSMKNIVWQGRVIPLSVSIHYPWTNTLGGIPTVNWVLLVIAILCLLLIPLIWFVMKKDVLEPLGRLTYGLQELRQGNESYRINEHSFRYADEMLYIFESFDKTAEEIQRSKEKDIKMVKAELDNLRLQVNPHMLLNSYNMIFALAQTKKFDTIQDYSLHLINYFRYVLRKTDELVPVWQEMEFILNFIDIQKIRFPDSFHFTYTLGKGCGEAMIPPLLIENFVENSLKYALIPDQIVEVMVDVQCKEGQLHIAVNDTGNGIEPEVLKALNKGEPYIDSAGNRHIGIWNCMRRVEVFYGEKASLDIISKCDCGTQIALVVPYRKETDDETDDC